MYAFRGVSIRLCFCPSSQIDPTPSNTEVDTDPPASEPQRVKDLQWFEYGDIVLTAGSSQYRVHGGILAARSPVFQDMFAFPQPPDSELVDGCPLVRLPDPATEVTVFLKAIFDPEFFMPFPAQTTFENVVGCLRLSHKYGVDYLRRRALVHLSSGYRTMLSEWDSSTYKMNPSPGRSASDITTWFWPTNVAYNMSVINLAREVDALWVLPIAFYRISASFSEVDSDVFHGTVYNGAPTSLSLQDQKMILIGHRGQSASTNADILRFLSYPRSANIQGCELPTHCDGERLAAIESSREMIRDCPSIPLDIWVTADWNELRELCPACLAVLKDTHQKARQAFWDKLPEMYGLPPWEELEKMKEAAIGNGSTAL
ncbi:hypothetical protein C8R44DRAFT_625570 [Mycena epipterygia]|nr:hypothetical protein C8R44DRAFT_625570 [Mycena epipterygia]